MIAALSRLNSQHAVEVSTLRSAHPDEVKGFVSQREEKATAALQAMERQFESEKAAKEAAHKSDTQRLSAEYSESLSSVRTATNERYSDQIAICIQGRSEDG